MNPFDTIRTILSGAALAETFEARLALLREQLEVAEKENRRLEEENAQLKNETATLRRQLPPPPAPGQYIEHRGAFFRRRPSGEPDDTVFCFKCKTPMFAASSLFQFQCSSCKYIAPFRGTDLQKVLASLPL